MKRGEEEENRGKGRRVVIGRSRAVICVVSCSANFNQVAICLIDSHPLFRSSFSPCSLFPFFFFSFFFPSPLVPLLRSARRVLAQEENRPRHAISKKLRNSHASTAFPRGKEKKKGKKGEKKITPSWAS